AGLVVGFGPRQLQYVGEEPLGEPVPADHPLGELLTGFGERDPPAVAGDQSLALEPTHHLADGGTADLEPLGDPGLDDIDVVLVELEDALTVLLEGWVVLSRCRHGPSLRRFLRRGRGVARRRCRPRRSTRRGRPSGPAASRRARARAAPRRVRSTTPA